MLGGECRIKGHWSALSVQGRVCHVGTGGGGFGGGTLIGKRLGCMVVARGVGRWGFGALDHFPMPSCHQRSHGFQHSEDILRVADLTNDRSSSD